MPSRRSLPIAALVAGVVLLASACSLADQALGGGHHHRSPEAPPATRAPRAAPHRPATAWATGAPVRVVMNDRFRYQPASIMVRAGRQVTFAVHNAGKLPHEFILGDRATQLDHEREMQAAPADTGQTHTHAHMHDMGAMAATGSSAAGALTVPGVRPAASPGPSTSPGWSSTAATSSATGPPA